MQKRKLARYVYWGLCLVGLTACTNNRPPPPLMVVGNTVSLSSLQQMHVLNYRPPQNQAQHLKRGVSDMRRHALTETALSIGAQSGLAWQTHKINQQLIQMSPMLMKVFNFNALMLAHNVLPPVLVEARNVLNLTAPDTIRLADRNYKIVKQARFVTTPPDWRQYLWLQYHPPARPDATLLPRNRRERQIWFRQVTKGWYSGLSQANTIYGVNLAYLQRDMQGMILYRLLLLQNMVSAPFVAKTNLGVTGDATQLHINDHVLRISRLPALKPNSRHWRPVLAQRSGTVIISNRYGKLPPHHHLPITIANTGWRPVISPTA